MKSAKDQGYFTTVSVDAKPAALGEPVDESATFGPDGKLRVRFRLDLAEAPRVAGRPARVEVRDPGLFVDFRFSEVLETKGLPNGCAIRLDDPKAALPADRRPSWTP